MKGGDLNTMFFHQIASARKKSNLILGLFNEQEVWVTEPQDLNTTVSDYFTELFKASDNLFDIRTIASAITSKVSLSDNDLLIKLRNSV